MTDPFYKKLPIKNLPVPAADEPAALTMDVVSAIQAVERGEANADQQKKALDFIISRISGAYEPQFRKDARSTDFGLGRAFVGQQIVGILKINLTYFLEKENRR